MKLNDMQIRQGDVLFVKIAGRPNWARNAERDQAQRLVAEHGESSGHAHAIRDKNALGFRATTPENAALAGLDYVEVGGSEAVTMRHEFIDGRHAEHAPVSLAPGGWERAVQVEYDPEEERRVAD